MLLGDSTVIEPRLTPSCFNGLDVALSIEDASIAAIVEPNVLSGLAEGETTLVASVSDEEKQEEVKALTIVRIVSPVLREADLVLLTSLETVESEAFAGTDAEVITCPVGLRSIGSRAFADCADLAQIVIPEIVVNDQDGEAGLSIAEDAFEGCKHSLVIFGTPGGVVEAFAQKAGILFATLQ